MKSLIQIAFLLSIGALMIACQDDDIVEEPETETVIGGNFSFEDLEVGQTFQFSLLQGEQYYNNEENNLFSYTNDTLEIELIKVENNVYTFSERILPTSAMHSNNDINYWMGKDSVYVHDWVIENDTIKIAAPEESFDILSHLFFFGDFYRRGVFLPLREFSNEKVEIEGWKTEKDYCECDMDLYTEDFTLFNTEYDRLNVAVRDLPMQTDGNGSTILFSEDNFIVRSVQYSWWTGTGFAWDRINK